MGRNASEMRAAVIAAPGTVRLSHVPVPEPGPGQVRVRLEGCGVCGSNLAPWEGRPWFAYPLAPGELGHEGWGTIDAFGPGVTRFQLGERVALLSYRAYAEFDVAPENAVVRLPAALEGQPFPGEALGCAMNVFRRSNIHRNETVAVIGIGFLGALLTALSARAGARVIAISRRACALERARALGAAECIPLLEHDTVVQRVNALTEGRGCHCVIEATGQQAPLDLAGDLARERGRLVIAGYHQDGPRRVNLQQWNWKGLDVINAHERDARTYVEGIEAAVDAVAGGQLDPRPLFTHRFELAELACALDAMKERPDRFLKALVTL